MKKFISIIAAGVLALSLSGCNIAPRMGAGNTVVASAGNSSVLLRNLNYNIGVYKYEYESIYSQMGFSPSDMLDFWLEEVEEGVTMEDEIISAAFESAKKDAVLLDLARAEGITYDEEELAFYQAAVESTVMNLASRERTGERAFYESIFVTPDEFIEVEKELSIVNQYRQMIIDSVDIPETDIESFYNFNREDITEYTVRHILIKADEEAEDEEAAKAEALELAEDILRQAQEGADFGELAEEYSEDEGSKHNNGEYVITADINFVQPFKDWTFTAAIGDFGIIETEHGYHVMHLVYVSTLEDHIESITNTLKESRGYLLLEQIIEDAGYEWVVDEEVYNSISIVNFGQ